MELQVNLDIDQVINLIRQLPDNQRLLVKKELDHDEIIKEYDLTDLLMRGPVMSEEEKKRFTDFNKEFDKWTKNLSV